MEKVKIVEITWLDTYHVEGSGITRKEVSELRPLSCHIYGRVIEETDDHITIASSIMEHRIGVEEPIFEDLEYREVTCIPKGVVQSIRELK